MQKLIFQTESMSQCHLKIQICMQKLLKIGRLLFLIISVCPNVSQFSIPVLLLNFVDQKTTLFSFISIAFNKFIWQGIKFLKKSSLQVYTKSKYFFEVLHLPFCRRNVFFFYSEKLDSKSLLNGNVFSIVLLK